jgi:hypothetical protein
MNIDWTKFYEVAVGAIGFTAFIVTVYSLGVRLLTNAQHVATAAAKGDAKASRSELYNRVAAYALFALAFVALAYGVFLMFDKMYNSK